MRALEPESHLYMQIRPSPEAIFPARPSSICISTHDIQPFAKTDFLATCTEQTFEQSAMRLVSSHHHPINVLHTSCKAQPLGNGTETDLREKLTMHLNLLASASLRRINRLPNRSANRRRGISGTKLFYAAVG